MTLGQRLILQQLQLVALARGWDLPKTIKKTQGVLEILTKAQSASAGKEEQKKPTPKPATPKEAKLIAEAEKILKDLQAKGEADDSSDHPLSDPPQTGT